MPKTKLKTKTVTNKNQDGTAAGVLSASPLPSAAPLSQEEADRVERTEEVADHAEFQAMQKESFLKRHADALTQYLEKRFKVKGIFPNLNHKDSRYPMTQEGHLMSVTRYYPTLKLIFDVLPKGWTPDMAQAKKWWIENIHGEEFRYIWRIEGEKFKADGEELETNQMPETVLLSREKPLKAEPSYKFIFTPPMRSFQQAGRVKA